MRILLVSTTAIGDTIMATPFIRATRKRYPAAHITLFAHYRRLSILEHNPHFNVLLPYYGKGKKLLQTLWLLRKGNFDLAVVLHANDPDIVPLVRWTAAPQRIGWGESKWARLFTQTIFRTNPPEHFMLHKKRLMESIGIPVEDLHTEIFFQPDDERAFRDRVKLWLEKTSSKGSYVVMHGFGTNPYKWWPIENFFKVAQHIYAEQGWNTVFVGDNVSLKIVEQHPDFRPTHHFVAKDCTVRESAWIIKQSRCMLTTDSGPMHLAFAVQCPTLCLFGPTQPSIHGPCFDLNLHHVLHRNPLTSLAVNEVAQKWDETTIFSSPKNLQ